ncbi:MAG: gliding motility-associated C-terminal domain-containing protein [Candidatus Aegiribacteria sp.]|nr:gliding motility-associated C-terminal domain-containing protein [Candidatus Aegiribacteria sp.]
MIVSDSSEFRELWANVECPVLQPSSWPTLNNSTQQGEEWADQLILRDNTGQATDYVPYDDDWGGAAGISLEKLNPEFKGYDSASWSGCMSGGTPGNENSCISGSTGGEFLEFHPNPFSPDGDGRDDLLTIEMNFNSPENEVTLEIYNVQGRLILELLNREACGSSRVIIWDGTGENGQRLVVGRYIIFLGSRAIDTGEFRETCEVVILARPL